jgi:lysophospholipase L1-like esterase
MRLMPQLVLMAALVAALHAGEATPLLSNGDFEAGDGKPAAWGTPAGITWEAESGNHFLRFVANEKMLMSYREVDVRGKTALQFSFRARHVGIKAGAKPWFDGRIMLSFRDADKKELKGGPSPPYFRGTSEAWTEKTIRFNVPEGAVTLAIMPCLFNAAAGTLDLDDLSLIEIDPALVDAGVPKGVDDPALPQAIAANDPHLKYVGRWDTSDAGGPRSEWPATQVHLTLEGTAINVVLAGSQAFQVVVDGAPTKTVTMLKGQSVYAVASGLAPGSHRIELCKRTEGWGGPVQVKGFQIPADAKLLDPPTFAHRIMFIGDSITCGYGNEAKSQNEHFTAATENAWLAWGAVAARTLDAELTSLAISGSWLQQNEMSKPVMPEMWVKTMPFTKAEPWDQSRFIPDVVVVNLGTNDKQKPIEEQAWRDAYAGFIGQIRTAFPAAHVFLCIGPMSHGQNGCIATYNAAIAADFAAKGDAKIHALALAMQKQSDGIGADWHPSAKTHQLMADALTAEIRKELGW